MKYQHERVQRLQGYHAVFGGPLYEISQFRRQADTLMAEARVTTALDLITACAELFETYRRGNRLALADADRQRLQGIAAGIAERKELSPEAFDEHH